MDYQILETKERVLADNEKAAAQTREQLKKSGALLVNLMGSPGAGKTTTLLQLIRRLGKDYRLGVMDKITVFARQDLSTAHSQHSHILYDHLSADMKFRRENMGRDCLLLAFQSAQYFSSSLFPGHCTYLRISGPGPVSRPSGFESGSQLFASNGHDTCRLFPFTVYTRIPVPDHCFPDF